MKKILFILLILFTFIIKINALNEENEPFFYEKDNIKIESYIKDKTLYSKINMKDSNKLKCSYKVSYYSIGESMLHNSEIIDYTFTKNNTSMIKKLKYDDASLYDLSVYCSYIEKVSLDKLQNIATKIYTFIIGIVLIIVLIIAAIFSSIQKK